MDIKKCQMKLEKSLQPKHYKSSLRSRDCSPTSTNISGSYLSHPTTRPNASGHGLQSWFSANWHFSIFTTFSFAVSVPHESLQLCCSHSITELHRLHLQFLLQRQREFSTPTTEETKDLNDWVRQWTLKLNFVSYLLQTSQTDFLDEICFYFHIVDWVFDTTSKSFCFAYKMRCKTISRSTFYFQTGSVKMQWCIFFPRKWTVRYYP